MATSSTSSSSTSATGRCSSSTSPMSALTFGPIAASCGLSVAGQEGCEARLIDAGQGGRAKARRRVAGDTAANNGRRPIMDGNTVERFLRYGLVVVPAAGLAAGAAARFCRKRGPCPIDLRRGDRAGARCARRRCRRQPQTVAGRPRHRRAHLDGERAPSRRDARRQYRRADVCRRPVPRELSPPAARAAR